MNPKRIFFLGGGVRGHREEGGRGHRGGEVVARVSEFFLTKNPNLNKRAIESPAVCLSDLYDVFLLDIVRDTRQNLWT